MSIASPSVLFAVREINVVPRTAAGFLGGMTVADEGEKRGGTEAHVQRECVNKTKMELRSNDTGRESK